MIPNRSRIFQRRLLPVSSQRDYLLGGFQVEPLTNNHCFNPISPPTIQSTCSTFWPKNGTQPHYSPRLRCFNRKITKKLHATCKTRHLFWLVIFPPCNSRQGPPLWNWGIFDNFRPLPTTLNVIWLQKVVPNLPISYLGKVKKNWQLFPLIFFGESQKYERGGVFPPPPPRTK